MDRPTPPWQRLLRGTIRCLMISLVLLDLARPPAAAESKKSKDNDAATDLFSDTRTNALRLQIEIPAPALPKLRARGWGWGVSNRDRPEVQVAVREGGRTYTNVALHLKGSAGSFQPVDSKPGLTLNFDKYAKGQKFHGLSKLSLNNSVQDPSFLSEKICRELFLAAGIPAPRADFAVVELNGRKLGTYVLLEGYSRQFLKRHFQNTKGNLYDGGFLRDVDARLSTNSGDNPNDQSDLRALVAAANEDRSQRFERLGQVLDLERFITFLATEILLCHWDGYAMNKNNYRVYHDLDSDRILFMPHGMDQMFGVMMTDASMAIRPPMQGLVARALMDTPEGRRRYYARLAELNQSIFNLEIVTNRLYELAARVHPLVSESGPAAAETHKAAVASLCERIIQRKQNLDEQLTGSSGQPLAFDSTGTARLTNWISMTNFGRPLMTRERDSQGRSFLRISAANGSSIGSWRCRVLLEDGHYSFEARLQTKDVTADSGDRRAGAGLRVSQRPAARKVLGLTPWTATVFEFDVPDGIHDVELVCELRASSGEAWFEAESLTLIRH